MLQESPKVKTISKNRKGKPKVSAMKMTSPKTKSLAARELGQTLTRYTKTIKYNFSKPR